MISNDNDALLKEVFLRTFAVAVVEAKNSFLDELKLDLTAVDAYFDKADKLPVTVLRIKTHPTAARNGENAMHSGALCTMFDHLSTFTVFADPGWWESPDGTAENVHLVDRVLSRLGLEFGLSRNIKMHLQRPVPLGATVYFVTKLLENTPASTYFFSRIYDENGLLLASGHHDKVKLTKPVTAKL